LPCNPGCIAIGAFGRVRCTPERKDRHHPHSGISLTPQNTNPHELYIWYHIILYYGQRHPSLFRSHRRWYKLLPTLGEVVGLEYEEVSELFGRGVRRAVLTCADTGHRAAAN
jgi:hypothetical protein